jgi:MinD-like ATPase involved in chromosome partitioning or flagellar assembly
VLLDLDPAGPGFEDAAGGDGALGLADLINGAASFGEVLHRDRSTRLHILPAGRATVDRRQAGEVIASALDALSVTYDFVVAAVGTVDTDLLDLVPQQASVLIAGGSDEAARQAVADRLPEGVQVLALAAGEPMPVPA